MSHLLWIIVIRPVNRASNQTKVKKGISKREENQECYEAKADHFPKISGQCPPCYSDSMNLSLRGGVYSPFSLNVSGIVSQL